MNIAIVVDSTAVIGKVLLDHHKNLYSVPLNIIFEQHSYADGIDLTQDEFFRLMKHSDELPTTSQPSIGEVEELFTKLVDEYDHIIYITISSKISGTYESGMMVRQMVSEDKITVFDSLFTSIIQKQMAIEALKMVDNSKSVEEIIERLEYIRSNSEIILVVDELKHLQRTGRIGNAAASIGHMLQIKPVLALKDGKIELIKKVKTIKKAHMVLIDMINERELNEHSHIIIAEADADEYATNLREKLLIHYPNHKIAIDPLSPVISVHSGPRTIGIGWVKEK